MEKTSRFFNICQILKKKLLWSKDIDFIGIGNA